MISLWLQRFLNIYSDFRSRSLMEYFSWLRTICCHCLNRLLHKSLAFLKGFQRLPSSAPLLLGKEKSTLLRASPGWTTAGAHRHDGQGLGPSLSSSLCIICVPVFIGGLLKSPALPEGLSLGQKGSWSEMASHMLAALPEFLSLATLCHGRAGQQPCYFHQPSPM